MSRSCRAEGLAVLAGALLAACSASDGVAQRGATAPPPPVSGDWDVDAGALKLKVDADPYRLHFFDASGAPLLDEAAATGPAPEGTLGFYPGAPAAGGGLLPVLPPSIADQPQAPVERRSGWMHATRVLQSARDGATFNATLATSDPLQRTLTLRAQPQSDGVIALGVEISQPLGVQAMGIGFAAEADERYLGFGERSNAVNQRGRAVEHYVGEGPYQDDEYPFVSLLVPKWGIRWRKDATYFPMPWLLSSRGYGVLIDNDALGYHRLTAADAWSVETEDTALRLRVFAGPTPAEVLRRLSATLGRQPKPYAPWFFGPWLQADGDDKFAQMRAAHVPLSLAATYTHYLPCGDQQGSEQAQRDRTAALHALGLAVHTYFNPMICTRYQPAYDDASAAGVLMKNAQGQDYTYPYTGSTIFTVAQFDFANPAAIPFYGALAAQARDHGYEGWMEDFGEYTPLDARSADGATGTALHNRYARDYHCGVLAATADGRPLARFARSGWTGAAACEPLVWGGDPSTSFGFDGLESSIYQALSIGLSGVGLWGSDIGGFFGLGTHRLTDELLDRWTEFGAFSGVMRNEATGFGVPPYTRPQPTDEAHLPLWRRYARLRTQLWPYLQAAVEQYYATGMPLMRHAALTDPADAQALGRDDQYEFGPDLLVAPVYVDGARTRALYLPAGRWIDAWRTLHYNDAAGRFDLGAATVLDGAQAQTLPAPLEEIPLLIRAGALLALLPEDVQTLSDHGDDPALVHLADRADRLRLLAFPRGTGDRAFYADETLHSQATAGRWTLRIDGARSREYTLDASLAALEAPFIPCSLSLDGSPLSGWTYDPAAQVLHARFSTRSGTLVARTCD